MKLFEVAIIYVPKADDETEKAAKEARREARLLVPPFTTLVPTLEDAKKQGTLSIPNEFKAPDKLPDVEVLVRPF